MAAKKRVKAVRRAAPPATKRVGRRTKPNKAAAKVRSKKAAVKSAVKKPGLKVPSVDGYVQRLPPPIMPIVRKLRELVRAAAPEATERLDPDGPSYDAHGVFARIEPKARSVLLTFLKGSSLDDPDQSLVGAGAVRALEIDSVTALRESVLQGLVRQAVLLNVRETQPVSGAV